METCKHPSGYESLGQTLWIHLPLPQQFLLSHPLFPIPLLRKINPTSVVCDHHFLCLFKTLSNERAHVIYLSDGTAQPDFQQELTPRRQEAV